MLVLFSGRLLTLVLLTLGVGWVFSTEVASSQTAPRALVLWTAEDIMLPIGYQERALPTPGSALRVSTLLLPLSAQTPDLEYRWFINEQLFRRDTNLKSIRFIPAQEGSTEVRVEIRKREVLIAARGVSIPIVKPELGIYLSGVGRVASGMAVPWQENLLFRVIPVFFPKRANESVAFQWMVDGSPVVDEEGQRESLNIELAPGDFRPLRIAVDIHNNNRPSIQASNGVVVNLTSL